MPVNFLELLMGTSVDLKGLDEGLKKAEAMAESAAKKITEHFGAISIGIATAIAGTVLVALEKAIRTTTEWGLEMEHLSNRMGVTATQAATLVGVMERYGISAGIAARSMQIMTMEARQTTEALDPFNTKMGKLLGTLRDTNGHALNMSQVFDLARQKVAGAATETEKLQVAQSLVGTRMAGQLLPVLKLTNEQWEKQKSSVEAALGPVQKAAEEALAYKQATSELEQVFRGLQVTLGTELLPAINNIVHSLSGMISSFKDFKQVHPIITSLMDPLLLLKMTIKGITEANLYLLEKTGLVAKGTLEEFKHMDEYQEAAHKAALEADKLAHATDENAAELEKTEKREKELVALSKERVSLAEKARALGIGSEKEVQAEITAQLEQLAGQRKLLEKQLADPTVSGDTRLKIETDLAKNRIQAAETVSKATMDMYKQEELQIKAFGEMSLASEIALLQRKLSDEHIVGDERLKLEGEIFTKRKQYLEQALKVGQQLGMVSVDTEIAYRKAHAMELLGRGDAIGAGQELAKARDLAIKQADEILEFTKKIRVVSLQDEIAYQKQKLQVVKGNAEEEMKILGAIADTDKQLYDKRLAFNLSYTQNILDEYAKVQKAAQTTGEVQTYEYAKNQTDRKLVETTREAGQVLHGGGTDEQRKAAVEFAQFVNKQVSDMQEQGKELSSVWKDAASTAKDILKAASGGEVRSPGQPNPTVGSLLSPAEGLATSGLARGSDIPRLDTSFTDLAVRVRDVLLGTIPNIQNFSDQLARVTKQMASLTGVPNNPGIIGPGGGSTNVPFGTTPNTGSGTPAPTVAPGGTAIQPTAQVGVGGGGGNANRQLETLASTLTTLAQNIKSSQDQNAANAESLASALAQVRDSRAAAIEVKVSIDPNSGDLLASALTQQLTGN